MNMKKYKKKIDLIVTNIEGKIYLGYEYDIYEINEISARILALCNGKNTINDIVDKISNKYCMDKNIVEEDVKKFLHDLIDNALIEEID